MVLVEQTVKRVGTSQKGAIPEQPWATVKGDQDTGNHPLLLLSSLCIQVTVKYLYWEVELRKCLHLWGYPGLGSRMNHTQLKARSATRVALLSLHTQPQP